MAVHQISILGPNVMPDATGRCWAEPYDVMATNDVWKMMVFRFKDPAAAQAHGVYGQFTLPQNFVSAPAIIPIWTSTAITGNCRWRHTYRNVAGSNTTSMDQTGNQEQILATSLSPGAANRRVTASLALTAANFAAGVTSEFLFERFDDTGVDTMAADAVLFDLLLQYADQ